MHAAAEGKSTLGISRAVGASAEDPGGKLPQHVSGGKPSAQSAPGKGLQDLVNKRKSK